MSSSLRNQNALIKESIAIMQIKSLPAILQSSKTRRLTQVRETPIDREHYLKIKDIRFPMEREAMGKMVMVMTMTMARKDFSRLQEEVTTSNKRRSKRKIRMKQKRLRKKQK